MRIGFSTSVIQRGKTGVTEYFFSLLRALAKSPGDHHFILFVLEKDLPLFEPVRPAMELVPMAECYRAPVRNLLWHQTALPRLAVQHRLDVLHVPSFRRMLWHSPCPRVVTVHDLAAFHVAQKYDWTRIVAGRLAGRQEELIAVSKNTAQDMVKFWGIQDGHATVIHPGVDHERFSTVETRVARTFCRHRFGLQQPFFLWVSRPEHPDNNPVRLLSAFEQFKVESRLPWQLVLAGNDWPGANEIHAAIACSPARNDIRALGFVSAQNLPMLYRDAGVFVYSSLHEGFGLPALEAMASGCPVLCSTRGALGEVVGDAAATVDPEDVTDLKDQMIRLAGSDDLRRALRTAGLKRSKHFDWDQTAAQTLAVYSRAATAFRNHQTRASVPIQPVPGPPIWRETV